MESKLRLGARLAGEKRCVFSVWAPLASGVEVHLFGAEERVIPMDECGEGYYQSVIEGNGAGTLYKYRLNGSVERPDPASRSQPQGVHGPSEVVDPHFDWQDGHWRNRPLPQYVIYELHVGTFTAQGTFDAVIPHLDRLAALGITAVEIMPVAQFPGSRNWGYDGVGLFSVQNSYGGPAGLRRLVNACHARGLAVILDVVYNHLGPEGNYLGDFGYYFTDRYKTPWGPALNFDGRASDHVRRFFIENALHWISDYHMDALRLDAVHAILDHSAYTFLEELAEEVKAEAQRLGRPAYLIAESAANDARLIRTRELGGYGLDAQWSDDLHHTLHTLLTGEHDGYYEDFGEIEQLVKALKEGFAYSGEYSPYRRRRHGSSSRDVPAERFVVFIQNHDQVGNRMRGERLGQLVSFDKLKLGAGLVLLSPYIPLLFMGEEYGESAPFPYFVSHSDPELVEAVRRGRREEFAAFGWEGEIPDPQAEATFESARLNHELRHEGRHRVLHDFHAALIRLRQACPALAYLNKERLEVTRDEQAKVIRMRRWHGASEVLVIFNFEETRARVRVLLPKGNWYRLFDSAEERWLGQGSSVPAELNSEGHVALEVGAAAFVVLGRTKEV